MNEILAILKLAAKFGNKKDIRQFVNHVQVSDKCIIATDGHIAIRISSDNFQEHKTQYTIESIEKAAKVDNLSILECLEPEKFIRFPNNFNNIFHQQDRHSVDSATFNVKYLLKICNAIESLRKDLKLPKGTLTINPLSSDSANLFTAQVHDIKIEIALMPMKGAQA
jgi:hypothetical protein